MSSEEHSSIKQCSDCKVSKPLDSFPRARSRPDGRGIYCSSCYAVRYRAHRVKKAAAEGRTVIARQVVPEGSAYCPACLTVKRLDEFGRNAGARNGRTSYCKPCHNAKTKENAERLYGGQRTYHLKRRYGVTAAEVDAMIEAQGGVCALCQEREPQHVDHDHRTGAVRGVLCSCCNQGLGNFRDRADLLREGAAYLQRTTDQPFVVREQPGVYAVRPSVG